MMDWQVGDLAIRVERDPSRPKSVRPAPPMGLIVRVIGVVAKRPSWPWGGLVIEGWPSDHPTESWCDLQFRKIRPDEHEGEREDWQLLLDSMKRKVRA